MEREEEEREEEKKEDRGEEEKEEREDGKEEKKEEREESVTGWQIPILSFYSSTSSCVVLHNGYSGF